MLIEEQPQIDIAIMIVWIDMLPGDNSSSAGKAAKTFQDESIIQFHDSNRQLGKIIAESFGSSNAIAWDAYLFYDRGSEWKERLPFPLDWAHQLDDPWADPDHFAWGETLPVRLRGIISRLIGN